MANKKPKILFVDDEDSIRTVLSQVLSTNGFEVTLAATVPEALRLINSEAEFDVLLSDLNIGQAGDGFTLISAMRRTHPATVNIIITGYPDLNSALEAIRGQVDDYFVKPTEPDDLLNRIRVKLQNKNASRPMLQTKSLSQIVQEGIPTIIERWLKMVHESAEISRVNLADEDRKDHLPDVLANLVRLLSSSTNKTSQVGLDAAEKHGRVRKQQGYTASMLIEETCMLQNSIFSAIHDNLLVADFSALIPDMMRTSNSLQVLLKTSLLAFLEA